MTSGVWEAGPSNKRKAIEPPPTHNPRPNKKGKGVAGVYAEERAESDVPDDCAFIYEPDSEEEL